MLRSESNSSITQSPIGWQISNFLTMLHEPTCGMCVCTSERVPLALVCAPLTAPPGCVCVRAHREWVNVSRQSRSPSDSCFPCMHLVCVCVCGFFSWVTPPTVGFLSGTVMALEGQISSFCFAFSAWKRAYFAVVFPDLLDYQTSNRKKPKRVGEMNTW